MRLDSVRFSKARSLFVDTWSNHSDNPHNRSRRFNHRRLPQLKKIGFDVTASGAAGKQHLLRKLSNASSLIRKLKLSRSARMRAMFVFPFSFLDTRRPLMTNHQNFNRLRRRLIASLLLSVFLLSLLATGQAQAVKGSLLGTITRLTASWLRS